jgi:hypothetical protein
MIMYMRASMIYHDEKTNANATVLITDSLVGINLNVYGYRLPVAEANSLI